MASERLADQVLQNKQEIVELDKRRQSTREALRDIAKTSDKNVWVTIGPILVKMEKQKALNLLKKGEDCEIVNKNYLIEFRVIIFFSKILIDAIFLLFPEFSFVKNLDQQSIDIEINKLRSEQKVLVSQLRAVECQAPLVGFDLKALDRKEVSALSASLPGF